MMTGVLWGFWHFPLWLMEGLEPIRLIGYIGSFSMPKLNSIPTFFEKYSPPKKALELSERHLPKKWENTSKSI